MLDFTTPEGQAEVRRLAADSDVLIENFKVGGLAKYGLDYASLAALNPRLIYCSITGFGQDGPYAPRPGYDFIIQGMSGMMDLTGEPDGAPQKIGVAMADITTGLYSVIAIQAALIQRDKTGRGQHIDMALLDTMTGVLANQAANYFASGVTPPRVGNAHMNVSPYAVFPTADGWFILAVGNDGQFQRFCGVVGIAPEQRWATNAGRIEHREPLFAAIGGDVALRPRRPAREAGSGRRPGRADQHGRTSADRSAGSGARHGDQGRTARRPSHPDPLLRRRPGARPPRAASWRGAEGLGVGVIGGGLARVEADRRR